MERYNSLIDTIRVWGLFDKEAYTGLDESTHLQNIPLIKESLYTRLEPWIEEPQIDLIPSVQLIEVARDTNIHPASITAILSSKLILLPVREYYHKAVLDLPDFSEGMELIDCSYFGISPKRVISSTLSKEQERIGGYSSSRISSYKYTPAILQMAIERSLIYLEPTLFRTSQAIY